jgi:hypothetical protein
MDNNTQQPQQPRIPRGKFRARAVGGKLGNSSQKGTPYVAVEFRLTEGELAGEQILYFGYFTDATTERTLESLRYCGWKSDDLDNLDGITDNEVELVIEHEKDDKGSLRSRVAWVNRAGGLQMLQAMSAADAKAFAARLRGAAAASRVKAGNASPSTPSQTQPQLDANGKPLPF